MTEEVQEYDRKDLKILAYKEKVAQLEDANADLRVEVTILNQQLRELAAQLPDPVEPVDEETSEDD